MPMIATASKIKVLIVDDSAVVRQVLARQLERDPGIEVVGTAPDPFVARDMIVELEPDVLTLDVEMPRMDGITFLSKLMQYRPMPVIVLSSLTAQGSRTALDALAAGAVEVLCKPSTSYSVAESCENLAAHIKIAARAHVRIARADASAGIPSYSLGKTTNKIIAIGASTGGVQALTALLPQLPADAPGTIIVQHMPPAFTRNFADHLNSICHMRVREAQDGDSVLPGQVLIAPGGLQMTLQRSGARYYVQVKDGPLVCHQKPSVEVLFASAAATAGANAIAVMLTGMGNDGATGMLKMRKSGARTIAQDEGSCVVFGMPKEAISCGAAEVILPLDHIPASIMSMAVAK